MKKFNFIIIFILFKVGLYAQNDSHSLTVANNGFREVKKEILQDYAPLPFTENFDSIWIDKLDVNDAPSIYWSNSPVTGNPSWRRDDDGASAIWNAAFAGAYTPAGAEGTAHSARFHSCYNSSGASGTLSVYIDFTTPGIKELTFGYINKTGNDSLALYLSSDSGATFNFIKKYTVATAWTLDTIVLGASTSVNTVLKFKATSDFGYTDIGIDNVNVYIQTPVNIGVLNIERPEINIFPNPTSGITNLHLKGIKNADFAIYSMQGQKVYSEKLNAAITNKHLDLSYLPKGIYMVRIFDDMNKNIFHKIIIQ